VVIEKNRVLDFLTINPFSTRFLLNIPRKHLKNLGKPIHDLKKPTQNPKSSWAKIYFFRHFQGEEKHDLNFLHYMELFDTKIDCFGGWNHHQRQLSLSTPGSGYSLSLISPKKTKKQGKWSLVSKLNFQNYMDRLPNR